MDLFDAIAVRRSCRKYDMAHLPTAVLDDIRGLLSAPDTIDRDADITLHLIEDGGAMAEIMPGVIGQYGKVRAPHYLLATGPATDAAYENAGYALEPVVLRLTSWRLGTCWIGGSAKGDAFRRLISYPDDHVALVIITVGTPADEGGHMREAGTGKRKPLDDIRLGDLGEWASDVEAARVAPSAGNLQPWRFASDGDRLDAFMAFKAPLHYRLVGEHLRLMNHVDMGIALAHVRVAAEHEGRPVRVERMRTTRPGLTYVASAVRD